MIDAQTYNLLLDYTKWLLERLYNQGVADSEQSADFVHGYASTRNLVQLPYIHDKAEATISYAEAVEAKKKIGELVEYGLITSNEWQQFYGDIREKLGLPRDKQLEQIK